MQLDDKTYNILKWTAVIALPALSTFVGTVAPLFDFAYASELTTIISAAGVLIGALIGVSTKNYNKNKEVE